MSQRVVIITGADGAIIERALIDKERLFVGRDKKCEIVLNDDEVSRKHAAIIYKFGVIYIENISPTGQILKANKPVEVTEWNEGEKIQIGPYSLSWQAQESSAPRRATEELPSDDIFAIAEAPEPEMPAMPAAEGEVLSPDADFDFNAPPMDGGAVLSSDDNAPDPDASASEGQLVGDNLLNVDQDAATFAPPSQDALDIEDNGAQALSVPANTGSVSMVDADAGTAIGVPGALGVVLRIMKGEEIGREIKLNDGSSWTVGRSANADIQINNPKLSREHFRLLRIGKGYRIEDLGSANGTKVNGVAVSDSPLNSFDTIQAGPVEFQFLIADPKAADLALAPPQPSLSMGAADASNPNFNQNSQMKTAFAAPVLYNPQDQFQYAGQAQGAPQGFDFGAAGNMGPGSQEAPLKANDEKGLKKLVVWFKDQPPKKRMLYGALALLLVLGGLMQLIPSPQPAGEAPPVADGSTPQLNPPDPTKGGAATAANDKDKKDTTPNAADASQISEDFFKLDPTKQKEIEEAYVKADRALQGQDWKTAYDASNGILRLVKQYKNTKDILAEAQNRLNENYVGNFNQSLNNVGDADAQNQEKAKLLLDNANKALSEQRWDDAEEGFSAVLVLDPNSDEAAQGLAKARNKDLNATVAMPTGPAKEPDPGQVAYEKEDDLMKAFDTQYDDAKGQMQNGLFGQALDVLRGLEQKVHMKADEYRDADRSPAAIRDTFYSRAKQMEIKTQELIDTANTQLRTEYSSQMADAEEFTNNKQYAQAREIYDKIVKFEPAFQEALDARRRLYDKIIVEARNYYQEALIYESVGDLDLAVDGYQKSRDLLTNVDDYTATEYYRRSIKKLQRYGK